MERLLLIIDISTCSVKWYGYYGITGIREFFKEKILTKKRHHMMLCFNVGCGSKLIIQCFNSLLISGYRTPGHALWGKSWICEDLQVICEWLMGEGVKVVDKWHTTFKGGWIFNCKVMKGGWPMKLKVYFAAPMGRLAI